MMSRPLRIAILLLALLATLAVASVSVLPAHLHAKAPSTDCELCCVAHNVSYEVQTVVPAAPVPLTHERILHCQGISGYKFAYRPSGQTRGPPSLFSL